MLPMFWGQRRFLGGRPDEGLSQCLRHLVEYLLACFRRGAAGKTSHAIEAGLGDGIGEDESGGAICVICSSAGVDEVWG